VAEKNEKRNLTTKKIKNLISDSNEIHQSIQKVFLIEGLVYFMLLLYRNASKLGQCFFSLFTS